MVMAHEDERFAEIIRSTKAIMFMGTPHRGSDIASLIRPLVETVNFGLKYSGGSILKGRMRNDLIDLLSRNSEALDSLNQSFVHRTKDMYIISCVEMRSPSMLSQPVVSEQSATLRIPNENQIDLNADHMSMCRFSSSEDSNYQVVRSTLVDIARKISNRPSDVESKSVRSLPSMTDSEKRYTNNLRNDFQPAPLIERVAGTCTWLLNTLEYRTWHEDQDSVLLWITGDAGCGKTTSASFLSETLEQQTNEGTVHHRPLVLKFFCARDNDGRNNGQAIVSSLLMSVLTAHRNAIRKVKQKYGSLKHQFGLSLEFLWDVFLFALDSVSSDHCYIIIDGLDECSKSSRNRLIACLAAMLDSRQVTEWKAIANTSNMQHLKIEDRPPGLTQDILSVIDYEMESLVRLRRCSTSSAAKLKAALSQKAQNSFLWVSVVVSQIKQDVMLELKEPNQLLDQFPGSLTEAYMRHLPSSIPQNASVIRTCVRILVASRRSLTLEEAQAFINVVVHGYKLTTADQLPIFQNSLELIFGSLIRLAHSQVNFIHSTVKDFFLGLHQIADQEVTQTYGTDVVSAHLTLADACIGYLLHQDLESDFFNSTESPVFMPLYDFAPNDIFDLQDFAFLTDEEATADQASSHLRHSFPAFDYAAMNWAHHFAMCEHVASNTLKEKARLLSIPDNMPAANWYRYRTWHSKSTFPKFEHVNELLIAAIFGFPERLHEILSSQDGRPDVSEIDCRAGLFWAASRGHSRVVQIFLQHGINPNFLEYGQTPLIVAICGGHQEVVSDLLQNSLTDANMCDKNYRSPLLQAVAYHQHTLIGSLLTHKDIKVNLADTSGFTPLLEAAYTGCSHCLHELKSNTATNFNACDNLGRGALSLAVRTVSLDAINLIVKNLDLQGVQSTDKSGRNALSHAAERSLLPIVKRLWDLKVSISQEDEHGRNAVSWAVSRPSSVSLNDEDNAVLRFLIEKSPKSVDVKDKSGWTPLAWALEGAGDLTSIKLLVEVGGVDINQQDHSGVPPLSWAAARGFEGIVCYLLSVPGIQKSLQCLSGITPVSYAARSGRLKILRPLLASPGVDPSIKDYQGRSPMDWARLNSYKEVLNAFDVHALPQGS